MSRFEDHLWREFLHEHGDDLAQLSRPASRHTLRRPRLVAGLGLGLAGGATALALMLQRDERSGFRRDPQLEWHSHGHDQPDRRGLGREHRVSSARRQCEGGPDRARLYRHAATTASKEDLFCDPAPEEAPFCDPPPQPVGHDRTQQDPRG